MSDVEIHVIAFDEASSVVESLGATMSATFQNIEGQTQTLANTTMEASSQMSLSYDDMKFSVEAMDEAQGTMSKGFGTSVMAMNNVALAGAGLFMSFERVQNAQVMVDRSNLMVLRSTETLEKAQMAYNDAIGKYAPNSTQAKEALDRLNIAQEAHQVALERAEMSGRNYNNTMMTSALMVIPSLISIIHAVSNAEEIWTGIQWALNVAMSANPIGVIIMAIAGLVAAFIAAYTYCEPFRDAINALGGALSGAFMYAVNTVQAALNSLWNNVLKPIGDFIVAVFVSQIRVLIDVWNALGFAWNAVCTAISGFWNTYIGPVVDFIVNIFVAELKVLMGVWESVLAAWNWLCSGISYVWNTVVAPVVDAIKWFADNVFGIFKTLFGWIVGGSVWTDLCNGLSITWNNVAGPLTSNISNFANSARDSLKGVGSAGSTLADGLNDATKSVQGTMSDVASAISEKLGIGKNAISDFISSVCFAHALADAAVESKKTMTDWADIISEKMGKGLDAIKNFNAGAEISGGGVTTTVAGGGPVPVTAGARASSIYITGPLVQIQGSADKATAKLAAELLQQSLHNVTITPSSYASPIRKRVQVGFNQ
jgi:hypothetical protein